MFVTNFIGLLTFGLVFNHAASNLITKSSEDENSECDKNIMNGDTKKTSKLS